jgi:hypothetical protein
MEVLFKDLFLNFGNTREKKSNYFDGEWNSSMFQIVL